MLNWIRKRWKKDSEIKTRKWRHEDALAVFTIEQQDEEDCDERQLLLKKLFDQMDNSAIYGAVVTENEVVKGFVAVWLGKTHEMLIYTLHVEEKSDWKKYWKQLIEHLLAIRGMWGKIFLSMNIREDEENLRQFLMNDIGFVITEMNEFIVDKSEPAHVTYTLRYPPPDGFNPHNLVILVDGEEKSKRP